MEIIWTFVNNKFTHIMVPGIGILTLDDQNQWIDKDGQIHEVVIENGDKIKIDGVFTLE